MTIDIRSKPGKYGETKRQKQFILTPSASDMVDTLAAEYGATRSDFVEQAIRGLIACDKRIRDAVVKGKADG